MARGSQGPRGPNGQPMDAAELANYLRTHDRRGQPEDQAARSARLLKEDEAARQAAEAEERRKQEATRRQREEDRKADRHAKRMRKLAQEADYASAHPEARIKLRREHFEAQEWVRNNDGGCLVVIIAGFGAFVALATAGAKARGLL